jgi:uncharacterized protein
MTRQIAFPWSVDDQGRTADATYADHVRDMVEQVLFTVPGERVELPEFGCLLADLVFEPAGPELAMAVQSSASGALGRWLGDLIAVESLTADTTDSTLTVTVSYRLLGTGEERTDTFIRGVPV